ncbi:MAG: HAD family hydrolase [Spirochaetia bacterium]|nr:HAD family hydrolase [Spirochaetia bacterium]
MEIKAICFDIDGTMYPLWMTHLFLIPTLFPSLSLMQSVQHFRHAIREENGEKTDPENQEGFLYRQALFVQKELKSTFSLEEIRDKIDTQFYERMKSSFSHIRAYPFLRETILLIKEKNIKIAALSDFPVEDKLKSLKVEDLIDYSACTEESGYLKPHKAPFAYMGTMMDTPLRNILYVGDSYRKDIIGASRVGMKTCLLLPHCHGKNNKEKFPLANFICCDYKDMKRQLSQLFN